VTVEWVSIGVDTSNKQLNSSERSQLINNGIFSSLQHTEREREGERGRERERGERMSNPDPNTKQLENMMNSPKK
jgi:hypothetical protein